MEQLKTKTAQTTPKDGRRSAEMLTPKNHAEKMHSKSFTVPAVVKRAFVLLSCFAVKFASQKNYLLAK